MIAAVNSISNSKVASEKKFKVLERASSEEKASCHNSSSR
jgi:hypothetical protein